MFAALTPDRKFLTVAVVNATESEQPLELNVAGIQLAGQSKLWRMTASNVDAVDRLGQPAQVEVKEVFIGNASRSLKIAPISINIYRFSVEPVAK